MLRRVAGEARLPAPAETRPPAARASRRWAEAPASAARCSPVGDSGAAVGGFSRPQLKLPNGTYPANMVNRARRRPHARPTRPNWQADLVSPTMNDKHHHNQPTVLNGYLILNGNEEFFVWDIRDPAKPGRGLHVPHAWSVRHLRPQERGRSRVAAGLVRQVWRQVLPGHDLRATASTSGT